jgi:hypothetical protein
MSCYRVLRLAKHLWCRGEDRQKPGNLLRGHRLHLQDYVHRRLEVQDSSRLHVSLIRLLHHNRAWDSGRH